MHPHVSTYKHPPPVMCNFLLPTTKKNIIPIVITAKYSKRQLTVELDPLPFYAVVQGKHNPVENRKLTKISEHVVE